MKKARSSITAFKTPLELSSTNGLPDVEHVRKRWAMLRALAYQTYIFVLIFTSLMKVPVHIICKMKL
jgi:hypothetical protein